MAEIAYQASPPDELCQRELDTTVSSSQALADTTDVFIIWSSRPEEMSCKKEKKSL